MNHLPDKDLLTPAEVATAFRVDPKTVTRWADAGKLDYVRTVGGHRRYWTKQVRDRLNGVIKDNEVAAND